MTFTPSHYNAQAPLHEDAICIEFRPCSRGTLTGFAKVEIKSWGLVLDGLTVHTKGDRSWAALPARPQLNQDGTALREPDGKIRYCKIMEFPDKRKGWEFSDQVVEAVRRRTAQ